MAVPDALNPQVVVVLQKAVQRVATDAEYVVGLLDRVNRRKEPNCRDDLNDVLERLERMNKAVCSAIDTVNGPVQERRNPATPTSHANAPRVR